MIGRLFVLACVLAAGTAAEPADGGAALGTRGGAGRSVLVDEVGGSVVGTAAGASQTIQAGALSLSETVDPIGRPLRAFLSRRAAGSPLLVGQSASVVVVGGAPPYTVAGNGIGTAVWLCNGLTDLDGDGNLDLGALVLATPRAPGSLVLDVSDAMGATAQVSLNATALPSVTQAAPALPVSEGTTTLFGAICPGTPQGLAAVQAALAGRPRTEARAFAWDAAVQAFVELPAEPTGGLQPDQGIFLASRVTLPLSCSGSPAPTPHQWLLQPGWNFIGMPPLQDGAQLLTSHQWPSDFAVLDERGNAIDPVVASALVEGPWRWDGASYALTSAVPTGVGCWVRNATASPSRALLLVRRSSDGTFAALAARASRGLPPPAPAETSAPAQDGGKGGCGNGLGAACLAGGLLLGLRRLRRA